MKIYTRTGDDGSTSLFGGSRVQKNDPLVEAYGTVDELNSTVGMARALSMPPEIDVVLERVQRELFVLGAEVASGPRAAAKLKMKLLGDEHVARLEQAIDAAEQGLSPLKSFILPGGCPAASALHVARTVARRAERLLVPLSNQQQVRPLLVVYLNRLSDLLFVLARRANHLAGVSDVAWVPEQG